MGDDAPPVRRVRLPELLAETERRNVGAVVRVDDGEVVGVIDGIVEDLNLPLGEVEDGEGSSEVRVKLSAGPHLSTVRRWSLPRNPGCASPYPSGWVSRPGAQ